MAILKLRDDQGNIIEVPAIQGKPGAAGYTPVKGVDYYTEADKTEMVNRVLSALPVYTGEVESV